MKKLYKILMTTFCLCIVAFASKTMAQTFNYTDPATGVTCTYAQSQSAWDCPNGQTCVRIVTVVSVPPTLEVLTFPETANDGTSTYRVNSLEGSADPLSANYPNVKEIIYPNSITRVSHSWTGLFGTNGFPNVRKVTLGRDVREFYYSISDLPLDTIVFLGDKVIQPNNQLWGSLRDVPANVKVIIPCGTMAKFLASVNDPQFGGGVGAWTHWADVTASCLVEAECLNTLTVLSSDVAVGNAVSLSSGSILTTTTPDNTSTTFSGTATLYALPKADIVFTGWSDGNLDNPRTVTVSSDTTFTANFAECEGVGTQSIVIDENTVSIYPNPAKNSLHIQSTFAVEQVIIYDINGRLLKQIANPTQDISISNLAKGTYLVKVKTPVGEVTRTIIKE